MITFPPDPAKLIIFNSVVSEKGSSRSAAATTLSVTVLIVLGLAALGGREIAELIGIDLDAFRVVGGVLVAGMGFEMLYGGAPSKAQGQSEVAKGPDDTSGVIMPLAIPLIAGPGAIVTTVTMAASNDEYGIITALISVGVVAIVTFISFNFLGGLLAKVSSRTMALLIRIGGLLLATIGTQMVLGGLKGFFGE